MAYQLLPPMRRPIHQLLPSSGKRRLVKRYLLAQLVQTHRGFHPAPSDELFDTEAEALERATADDYKYTPFTILPHYEYHPVD